MVVCPARRSKVHRKAVRYRRYLPMSCSTSWIKSWNAVAIASRGGGGVQAFIICLLVERLKQEGNIKIPKPDT